MTGESYFILFSMFIAAFCLDDLEPSSRRREQMFQECSVGTLEKPQFVKEPQTFQNVSDREIIIYSAFYEERPTAYGPSIRILAVGLQERFNKIGDLYCNLWYEDKDQVISIGPAIYKVIYPSLAHGSMWTSHFILCELPSEGKADGVPYAVSVTPTQCGKPKNILMILNRIPTPMDQKRGHALCMPPLYNRFQNWTTVVEQFEIHRLLGVNAITMYTFSVSKETMKALEFYAETQSSESFEIHLIPWRFPGGLFVRYLIQIGAINECYYRMRNKYKYITITDLDEVIVPRMVHTWPELMAKIRKDEYGAYLFQHAYFRRNYTLQVKEELISQSSFWRTDVVVPAGKIRSKAMYDADLAISLDVHSPYQLTSSAKEYIVEPSEGMLHHYRPTPMENFRKNPQDYRFIEDKYLEWMKKDLSEAYHRKVSQIKKYFTGEGDKSKHTEL